MTFGGGERRNPLCPIKGLTVLLPGLLHLASCFVFPWKGGAKVSMGKLEFAGKCRAIISVPCEWETELGDWQISWQGKDS